MASKRKKSTVTQFSFWDGTSIPEQETAIQTKPPKSRDTTLDKTYFGMQTNTEKVEWHYHAIHGIYPHGTYEQVVQACKEIAAKHSEPTQITLGKVFLSCASYAEEFWTILERILP